MFPTGNASKKGVEVILGEFKVGWGKFGYWRLVEKEFYPVVSETSLYGVMRENYYIIRNFVSQVLNTVII